MDISRNAVFLTVNTSPYQIKMYITCTLKLEYSSKMILQVPCKVYSVVARVMGDTSDILEEVYIRVQYNWELVVSTNDQVHE